jgi:hypothetical protein
MRPVEMGVQFYGLGEADWRSESDNVASALGCFGSTVGAIVGTRIAGMRVGAWGVGEPRARLTPGTGRRARR